MGLVLCTWLRFPPIASLLLQIASTVQFVDLTNWISMSQGSNNINPTVGLILQARVCGVRYQVCTSFIAIQYTNRNTYFFCPYYIIILRVLVLRLKNSLLFLLLQAYFCYCEFEMAVIIICNYGKALIGIYYNFADWAGPCLPLKPYFKGHSHRTGHCCCLGIPDDHFQILQVRPLRRCSTRRKKGKEEEEERRPRG